MVGENSENQAFIIDSVAPNEKWAAVFEDDGETGYLYLCYWDEKKGLMGIADHLWIYNQISPPIDKCKSVFIIWTEYCNRVGLIVDGECWGIFDIKSNRKMSAPREGNSIKSIEKEFWDNGLLNVGDPILLKPKIDK